MLGARLRFGARGPSAAREGAIDLLVHPGRRPSVCHLSSLFRFVAAWHRLYESHPMVI